jgi:AraC-like DNA-binding protein
MGKSGAWTIMKLGTKISICEPVNTEAPEVPPRSWAHHLMPMGIGTPDTESLTSYFIRLTESHSVTPRAFFVQGISKDQNAVDEGKHNRSNGLVSPTERRATPQVNGNGLVAEKWVCRLAELTQRNNLRFLTFLPWKDVLSNRTMHRLERAWCPVCLEDQRMARVPIYEQLRWAHRLVRVCPNHKLSLETKCKQCSSTSSVLCGKSRPGICPRCDGWLGHYYNEFNSIFTEHTITNAPFEIFIAEQIGELIAIAPRLTCAPNKEVSSISIGKCIDLFFDGNTSAFVRFFGMSKTVTSSFFEGRARYTNLELLLRIAFRVGITLKDLLNNENALTEFNPSLSITAPNKRLSPRRKKGKLFKMLVAAAEEQPPPSLNELAERLGYSAAYELRRNSPQLCDLITANHLEYTKGQKERSFSTVRLQTSEVIEAALMAALNEDSPPPLNQVGKSLGYMSAEAIRVRFPDLYKAVSEKRQKLITSRRDRIKDELKQAFESDPPISLDTISEKLGYRTTATLRVMYPEESRAIRSRYDEHIRKQFLSKIEAALRSILIEMPPPPLRTSLRRINISDGFLRKHFPKEHRAISTRYLEFRHEQSMQNKENDRNKIRAIVIDLIRRGVFPSMNAVLELSPANFLKRPEVWATIRQARKEFAHPV